MRTWDDYKEYVRNTDPEFAEEITEIEELSKLIGTIIQQRQSKGLSQRELAAICGMPQSSIARIESCKVMPNIDTLLRILKHLDLHLSITPVKPGL